LVLLVYTLWRNIIPFPEGAARWLPITAAVWLLAALAFVLLRPAVARRAGEQLTAAEGLVPTGEVRTGEAV
jgi:hypothetical protein